MASRPSVCKDVTIHDGATNVLNGSEWVYRVAIFGALSKPWIKRWQQSFYPIESPSDHCAHIASSLHKADYPEFLGGYGEIVWVEHNWRRVGIMDHTGKEIAHALVKLIDRTGVSDKNDIVEVSDAEWIGTEPPSQMG